MHVLVTGATGYIGGRLVPRLVAAGHTVRVLVREADPIKGRSWERDVEVVQGDLLEPATLPAAVAGIDAAYYLVHSMYGGADFEERDRIAARNFVNAWRGRGSKTREGHVIYLGGVEPKGQETASEHLRSRAEVGAILAETQKEADAEGDSATEASGMPPRIPDASQTQRRRHHQQEADAEGGSATEASGMPRGDAERLPPSGSRLALSDTSDAVETSGGGVTEFRAGPIIGSGSACFEMVRYLTERLPVMVTPRWVNTKVQPIAIRDVLSYLEGALTVGPSGIVEIGANVLSFKDMMRGVAAERGYRRWILPLPVLAPKLAARWVGLVTPIPNALAVPLVAGVTQDLIADTGKARALFPQVKPIAYREAVRLALTKIERGEVETRWSSAVVAGLGESDKAAAGEGGAGKTEAIGAGAAGRLETVIEDREGLARDQRTLVTDVPVGPLFEEICSIGGDRGWHVYRWAWWVRGVMDKLMGGPGLRRGRRHPTQLLEGEALDWWRVDQIIYPRSDEGTSEHPRDLGRGLLRLRAEMRVPGRAWLQWEVHRRGEGVVDQAADTGQPTGTRSDEVAGAAGREVGGGARGGGEGGDEGGADGAAAAGDVRAARVARHAVLVQPAAGASLHLPRAAASAGAARPGAVATATQSPAHVR